MIYIFLFVWWFAIVSEDGNRVRYYDFGTQTGCEQIWKAFSKDIPKNKITDCQNKGKNRYGREQDNSST